MANELNSTPEESTGPGSVTPTKPVLGIGAIVTGIVAFAAMAFVLFAFTTGASPYVTIAAAKSSTGNRLHLAGDLDKGSVHNNLANHVLSFRLKDANGDVVTVIHKGDPPANMGEATKIVAIGKMEGEKFVSDDLLIKCPSKYESEKKT